jgi:hypothetical protein
VVTITTVGYGDYLATTGKEMILVVVFALIGSIIIGYNLNAMGNLIDKMVENDKIYDEKLKKLNKFM